LHHYMSMQIRPDLLVDDLANMEVQINWGEFLPPTLMIIGLVSLPFITLGIRRATLTLSLDSTTN